MAGSILFDTGISHLIAQKTDSPTVILFGAVAPLAIMVVFTEIVRRELNSRK